MKNFILLLLYPMIIFSHHQRISSYPYLSGDTFKTVADFVYDEIENTIIIDNIKYGDVIFVKTDFLDRFFVSFHSKIKNPYVLITHNSDHGINEQFFPYLEDDKLLAWFAQNAEIFHPKLHPIPIGLANQCWTHGNVKILEKIKNIQPMKKAILLYMNFSKSTYPTVRNALWKKFENKKFCFKKSFSSFPDYLIDLKKSFFVLSPRGNGLDCHRTWEALYMGAIPIVETSTLDTLYLDLPVVIVENWDIINENFLYMYLEEMKNKKYSTESLYADYWFEKILHFKKNKNHEQFPNN